MCVSRTEMLLAWRYICARGHDRFISLTSWLAVIGMVLGVATLILVMSLMNGIQTEMRNQLLGVSGHITVSGSSRALTDYAALAANIKTIPGVLSAMPKIEGQVMVTSRGVARGAQVIAFTNADILRHPLFNKRMEQGSVAGMFADNGVLIGAGIASAMGLRVGDSITFISPEGHSTIAGMVPRIKTYVVSGIFKLGMHAYDSGLIVAPFASAQQFFRLITPDAQGVSQIDIMLRDSDQSLEIAPEIARLLSPKMRINTWQNANAGVFAALTIQRNVMVIILTLIVLVAAFNIVACLVMLVKEKRGDIGILRTLGATRASVLRIFMLSGFVLGAAGSMVGVALGVVLARYIETIRIAMENITGQSLLPENIYFLSTLPTKTDPSQVMLVVVFSFVLSLLATLYPALKAANLNPVEALKHD